MDFIAEDCNAGLAMAKMGKGIRLDARSYLATEVPVSLLGNGLNWWKQRQLSWEMGRHGRLFAFIRELLFRLPVRKTPQGIVWHKVTYLYLLCGIAIDWLRIPTFVALGGTATWWRNAILLMLFSAVPPLYYNYWSCRRRPDMQTRFWACISYPWYKQLYMVVAILGAIRAVCFYFGGHVKPMTIKQMLKAKDERCFWLDPRFATNPAWLADEAEGIAAGHNTGDNKDNISEYEVARPNGVYQSPRFQPSEILFSTPSGYNTPSTIGSTLHTGSATPVMSPQFPASSPLPISSSSTLFERSISYNSAPPVPPIPQNLPQLSRSKWGDSTENSAASPLRNEIQQTVARMRKNSSSSSRTLYSPFPTDPSTAKIVDAWDTEPIDGLRPIHARNHSGTIQIR